MKKHFLLLMMAFMSLAGYATDINDVNFSVGSVPYGTPFSTTEEAKGKPVDGFFTSAEHFLVTYDVTLVKGTHYTWDEKFYSDKACTTEVTLATAPVGTYYVKIEGKGAFEKTKVSSFKVEKRTVTVPLKATLTKVYGEDDPALIDDNIDWDKETGFIKPDDKSVFTGTLSYTHESENVGTQDINVTGVTATNYTLTVTGGITITAKPITAAMVTAVKLSEIYKGAAYTAADVTVNVKDGSTTLVAGTDFTVGLYTAKDLKTAATAQDVDTYYLGISSKTGANYSVATTLAAGTFEITKAGLTVRALPQEKAYSATADLPSTAAGTAFEVLGVLGTDDIDNDGKTTTFANVTLSGNTSANAGSYTITPDIAASNQDDNYDYNFVPATFTINQRELTITANDAKKVYGKAETTVTKMDGGKADLIGYGGVTLTPTLEKNSAGEDIPWAVPTSEQAEMKAVSVPASGSSPAVVHGDLKVVRPGAGTDENKAKYTAALEVSYNKTAAVWKNYKVVPVKGDFTITGGKIYVTALNQKKNYGEADPDWTAVKDVNFIVTGLSGDDALTTLPTLKRAAGETVKDYTITPSGAVAPEGYEDIVYATGTFTISQRPLTIVAKPQTLNVGDDADDLDQNAFTITNTKADEGLIAGDKASDVFALDIDAAYLPLVGGTYDDGIVKKDGAKAGNYLIAFVPGKLIVIDPEATIALNRPNKAAYNTTPTLDNAAAVIAAAAADKYTAVEAAKYNAGLTGAIKTTTTLTAAQATKLNSLTGVSKTTYAVGDNPVAADCDLYNATLTGAVSTSTVQPKNVTFGDFEMAKERWYSLTLPFDTDVKEVSEAFGYAVVDIFDTSSNISNDVKFKLWMGDLPANEPFLLKVYQAMNMNEATFYGKTIVNSDDLSLTDVTGNKFIGSYSAINGFEPGKKYFFSTTDGDIKRCGASTYLCPLAAYITTVEVMDGMSAAPRILIEEPDGTTTAINPISVENKQDAEGWYNINGMKLNNAPTQKGIYIKNGKKVIVK